MEEAEPGLLQINTHVAFGVDHQCSQDARSLNEHDILLCGIPAHLSFCAVEERRICLVDVVCDKLDVVCVDTNVLQYAQGSVCSVLSTR